MKITENLYTPQEVRGEPRIPFATNTRLIAMTPAQVGALEDLLDLLVDGYMLHDVATHFACSEANTFAEFLRAFGHGDLADSFVESHAEDDDEGDPHHPDYTEE